MDAVRLFVLAMLKAGDSGGQVYDLATLLLWAVIEIGQ